MLFLRITFGTGRRSLVILLLWAAVARPAEHNLICRCGVNEAGQSFGIDLDGNGRRYAPDRVVDVLHLQLDVTPDFSTRTVAGTTRIEFQPIAKPCTELCLDAIDLTVSQVRSDHAVSDHVNTGKQLIIHFSDPIPVNHRAYVEIRHSAQPARGLYFRTPEMGYPETDTQVWTQGEAHEARFWFPCFDYPNERSSTEVICHVPGDMIVLSNGRKISETTDENGLKRVQWLQEKPHVNYLLCLVAGKFIQLHKQHRNVPLGFYAQPSLAEHAENSFADTEQIMAFYEAEIGVPFPWEKYDQVTILDFVAGGMENTTLTTLTEYTIFSKSMENLASSHSLDAHEMAHQWFGDYLTCKDWSQLWLNEGFATYYAHLYEGHKSGNDAMLYGLYRDATRSVLPQSKDKRPIVYRNYSNASEQFDYRSYPKGAWVLHMLRAQLGPDLYRQCIREYVQRHALQSVVSDDLRQVVEELSGKPFDQFFDQWLYHGGVPDLTVNYSWQAGTGLAKVTVRQTQETNDDILLFHLPTKLLFVVDDKVIQREIEITERQHDFYVPLPGQPSIVRFDPAYALLANVSFSLPDEMQYAQLQRSDDMIGRLLAAKALSERKTTDAITNLRRTLQEDPFFGVRIAASEALRQIGTDEAYRALVDSLAQNDARVRQQVTEDVCSFYRPETLDRILHILEAEKNPGIQAAAIRALGKFHERPAQRQIRQFLNTSSFRNSLADAAIDAIEAQQNVKFVKPLMATISNRQTEFTSRGLASALVTLGKISQARKNKQPVREFISSFLHDPRSTVRRGAVNSLAQLRDPASAAVLESLARSDRDDRIANAAQAALGKLQETATLPPQEVVELRKQLTDLRKQSDEFKKQLESLQQQFQAVRPATQTPAAQAAAEPATSTGVKTEADEESDKP
jgi:aminopeptidase N